MNWENVPNFFARPLRKRREREVPGEISLVRDVFGNEGSVADVRMRGLTGGAKEAIAAAYGSRGRPCENGAVTEASNAAGKATNPAHGFWRNYCYNPISGTSAAQGG